MKIPLPPEESSPTPAQQEAMQAEAREDVRRRVRAQERQAEVEAELEAARRQRNRRSPWDFAPDSTSGFWFDMFGAQLFLGLFLGAIGLIISSVIWLVTSLRMPIYVLIHDLDLAIGARTLPGAPWVFWTIWGAVFGGALGYWLVAPQYGNRENRGVILLWPLLAMVGSSALLWAFVH
jgi:hypothetical protein